MIIIFNGNLMIIVEARTPNHIIDWLLRKWLHYVSIE